MQVTHHSSKFKAPKKSRREKHVLFNIIKKRVIIRYSLVKTQNQHLINHELTKLIWEHSASEAVK